MLSVAVGWRDRRLAPGRNLDPVSPRRNRPRPEQGAPLDGDRVLRGVESVQSWSDGDFRVRAVPGGAAAKTYRCPGCQQEIRPGVAHLVAWPADGRGDLARGVLRAVGDPRQRIRKLFL